MIDFHSSGCACRLFDSLAVEVKRFTLESGEIGRDRADKAVVDIHLAGIRSVIGNHPVKPLIINR